MLSKRNKDERGSALIEFMFSSLVWLPLLLGTIVFSINLIRAIQVSQLSRETGHMYAYGIDFAQPQNTTLLKRLSAPLNITQKSGNGALILSKITYVTANDCAGANMKACPNQDKYVFTNIYVFGNLDYAQTRLGTPDAKYYISGTDIQATTYLSDPSLVATNLPGLLKSPPIVAIIGKDAASALEHSGQYAYVSEVVLNSQAINWDAFSKTGSYARSIF